MNKIIFVAVLLFVCLIMFTGCSANKYNAKIFSNVREWISEEFLDENRVKGAYYLNKDYIEGESDVSDENIMMQILLIQGLLLLLMKMNSITFLQTTHQP